MGAIDEANDVLGLAVSQLAGERDLVERIQWIQSDLFVVGADIAAPPGSPRAMRLPADAVRRIEGWTDALEASLPPLTKFILPGGEAAAAFLQLARSVARRAERAAWRAREADETISDDVLVYLNRLSDLLFLLAREVNRRRGVREPEWAGKG